MVDNKNEVAQDTPQEEKEGEEIQQFIGIQLNNEIYGIPVEKIKTIVKSLQITNIPGTPPHIMGLMNLHGEILCVVDVKVLLNMGKSVPADNSRVAVIKTAEGPVGIFCDEVIDIYDIAKRNIEAALSTLSDEISAYLQGQVQVESGLMGILDIEKLLFKQEK
ncbi:MAG TPA: chemotaxis protein CheW [Candidatus Wunengus sp. YC63]|uniref:chemotaxis protein CheW n=1 Tax=unclassified Candidatus Wunengus TaxID=3367695 RepID=UPI0040250898